MWPGSSSVATLCMCMAWLSTALSSARMRCRDREKPFPVKASGLLLKEKVLQYALEARRCHPAPPIHRGDILIADICGTGRDIVAAADFDDD